MDLWSQTRGHLGWLFSLLVAAAGAWLHKRDSRPPERHRGRRDDAEGADPATTWRTSSWIGRQLTIRERLVACEEREQARLETVRVMADSHARLAAVWATERGEMAAYTERIQARVTELTHLAETLRGAQAAGSSTGSAPPSTNSTPSAGTSSPPSPKPSG